MAIEQRNPVQRFTDLDVWRRSHDLFLRLLIELESLPHTRAATILTDQSIRSVGSIGANIAEGFPVVKLGTPVYSEDLAAAFDKSSTLSTETLRAAVDKLFNAMHSDGRFSDLSNKWFQMDLTQAPK